MGGLFEPYADIAFLFELIENGRKGSALDDLDHIFGIASDLGIDATWSALKDLVDPCTARKANDTAEVDVAAQRRQNQHERPRFEERGRGFVTNVFKSGHNAELASKRYQSPFQGLGSFMHCNDCRGSAG